MEKILLGSKTDVKPMFCSATKVGNLVYTSGQLPVKADGTIEMEDITLATKLCLETITNIAIQTGGSKDSIVKLTILLRDMGQIATMNAAYVEFFSDLEVNPARTCFEVGNLPFYAPIEIEAIVEVK